MLITVTNTISHHYGISASINVLSYLYTYLLTSDVINITESVTCIGIHHRSPLTVHWHYYSYW